MNMLYHMFFHVTVQAVVERLAIYYHYMMSKYMLHHVVTDHDVLYSCLLYSHCVRDGNKTSRAKLSANPLSISLSATREQHSVTPSL